MATIETFLTGLKDCGLLLETRVINGDTRLVLSGDQEVIDRKSGIRKYIKEHREELITSLAVTHDQAEVIRYLPCHLSTYGLCSNQVIEQDETTWRMSADGLVFCLDCWQARHIGQADLAIPYLAEHNQPTDLEERIAAIMAGPGYGCCGGHDWIVDDGFLVCSCLLEKRKQAPLLRPVQHGAEYGSASHAVIDIEQEAERIAQEEGLPIGQARYWARVRTHLLANGYYEQLERDHAALQSRIDEYRETWLTEPAPAPTDEGKERQIAA